MCKQNQETKMETNVLSVTPGKNVTVLYDVFITLPKVHQQNGPLPYLHQILLVQKKKEKTLTIQCLVFKITFILNLTILNFKFSIKKLSAPIRSYPSKLQ